MDNDKLDMILEKMDDLQGQVSGLRKEVGNLQEQTNHLQEDVNGLKEDVNGLQEEVKEIKLQQMKDTKELKAMDVMILDEVERVHEIMLRRTEELKKKIG